MAQLINIKIWNNQILGYEPYFKENVVVATIDHKEKEIRPAHGYFFPHPIGKTSKRYARRLGYTFNNN